MSGPTQISLLFRSFLVFAFCSDATTHVSGRFNSQQASHVGHVDQGRSSVRVAASTSSASASASASTTSGSGSGSGDSAEAFFDPTPPQNVSALIGKTAFLTCVVRNLAKPKSVTWIRHRDVHILTVGEYTYTTDQRFVSRHNSATDEWVLVIKYVQERDAGIYECQIPSTTPRAFQVNLNIVVPHVRIQGSPDIHVNQGSVINLTCIISYSPEPPAFVFWYRGKEVVAYDSARGRIEVLTEQFGRETRSHLVIRDAMPDLDSGNYTCKPSIAREAHIKVHVLESEFPGALQESGSVSNLQRPSSKAGLLHLLTTYCLSLWLQGFLWRPASSLSR